MRQNKGLMKLVNEMDDYINSGKTFLVLQQVGVTLIITLFWAWVLQDIEFNYRKRAKNKFVTKLSSALVVC